MYYETPAQNPRSSKSPLMFVNKSSSIKCFLILIIFSTLSVAPTLFGGFIFDDEEALLGNSLVKGDEELVNIFYNDFWGVVLTHPKSHKSYRPLLTLLYRFDHWLYGFNPFWYHLENVFFHAVNSCLVYKVLSNFLWRYAEKERVERMGVAFWASMIFAVHPVHVVGRGDLLAGFVVLMGLLTLDSRDGWGWPWKVGICGITAALFKETGIVLPIMVIALDAWRNTWSWGKLLQYVMIAMIIGGFLWWRLWFQNGYPVFQKFDNPAAFEGIGFTKIASTLYIWSLNGFILLCPIWLCYDWSGECIQLIESVTDLRFVAALLFATLCFCLFYRSITNQVFMLSCILSCVTFLPSSNIILTVGFVIAERNLYLPSIGFALLVSYSILKTLNSKIVMVGIIVVFFARSLQRSMQWLDQPSLFLSGALVCPKNAKIHYNLATVYTEAGNIIAAEMSYMKAIELRPDYYQAMNNLGNLLRPSKPDRAIYYLKKAVEKKPDFAAAWMNLGIALSKSQNKAEALTCYKNALKFRKFYPDCEYNLGNLYLDLQNKEAALKCWMRATHLNRKHAQSWINLVILLEENGQIAEAKDHALNAVAALPDSDTLHFLLGNIFGKLHDFQTSEKHFKIAISICEKSNRKIPSKYFSNLGVLYHRWQRKNDAVIAYNRALQIDPYSKSTQRNLKMLEKSSSTVP